MGGGGGGGTGGIEVEAPIQPFVTVPVHGPLSSQHPLWTDESPTLNSHVLHEGLAQHAASQADVELAVEGAADMP